MADPARTIHLHPQAELAERVLLPGDPGRALLIAQSLLQKPLMFNHHRGLWGYTGTAPDGEPLTVQSTGMGGPSAAIVFEELIMLGVRRAVRVGSCGALVDDLELGALVVADRAIVADGASRALGADGSAPADGTLTAALAAQAGGRVGATASTDLFYEPDQTREPAWRGAGAIVVEMEAATLFTIGARHGVAVGCVLAVSDTFTGGGRVRIAAETLEEAGRRMGAVAAAALAIG